MPLYSRLALFGVASVLAKEDTPQCQGNDACPSQLEDDSLMQLNRLGVNSEPTSTSMRRSFIANSKPYFHPQGKSADGNEGNIIINEDGVNNTYYLPGATTLEDGFTVEYTPPYRFYLMNKFTTDYSNADNFYYPDFPGKTFSVDIDFKRNGPGCGCNLNFYLVSMPWPEEGKDHDWYCDAQCFDGLGCCHEFDMNEGNKEVQQMTNHACTRDYAAHPDWQCHKWGEPETKTASHEFSPGGGHTIDSNKPFTYSQRFDVNGDDFTFTTTISQEGHSIVKRMEPGHQMNAMMTELKKGMAFVTGYWFAADMNWMDGDECGGGVEHCNMNPAYLSNWRLTTNDGPAPVPTPPSPGPGPAPSPTPPSPGPGPAPSPGSKCCWGGGCTGCADSSNWCSESEGHCGQCGGTWC